MDVESQFTAFDDKAVRRGFIKKVYGILTVQILITAGIIAIFVFTEGVKNYVMENSWVYITSLVMSLVLIISLGCCPDLRRSSPMNIIALLIFTVVEGIMLGTICTYFEAGEVFAAMVITALVVLGLTLFAFQTKVDFTMMAGGLCVALLTFILVGFTFFFWPSKHVYLVYCGIGVLIFGLYIVFDTQIMLGGKHKLAIDPEEYIFAALNLYLDIVNMFMYILQIIALSRD